MAVTQAIPVVQLAAVSPAAPPLSNRPIPVAELTVIRGPEVGRLIPEVYVFPNLSDAATAKPLVPVTPLYSAPLAAPVNVGVAKHTLPDVVHAAVPDM